MLKLCGAVLLMTVPAALACSRYAAQTRCYRMLSAWEEVLSFGIARIRCQRMTLPRFAEQMAEKGPRLLRSFWRTVYEQLKDQKRLFDNLWSSMISELELPQETEEILGPFPELLQFYDAEEVARGLERMRKELETVKKEHQFRFLRDFKMYTGIQFSSALLLLILLF